MEAVFSERYGQLRTLRAYTAREDRDEVSEHVVQCVWYDRLFRNEGLRTDDGKTLKVVSPGWWNQGEGPDFRGAQLEINGKLHNGDVEIHLAHGDWRQHGHHLDPRYENVLLHVVLERDPPAEPTITLSGRRISSLLLLNYLDEDLGDTAERLALDKYPYQVEGTFGHCAALVEDYGSERVTELLHLAGEWRMVFKARTLRRRMERAGPDQAVYEALLAACGYAPFKRDFEALARQLPYDRARQLALEDALLLEAALMRLGGLLPAQPPEGETAAAHFNRLDALRRDRLDGLRPLPIVWGRTGVRPTNNPERRLAGAARFIARTARDGLVGSLERIWNVAGPSPVERRRAFEDLFPTPMGFWAYHCAWTGKKLARPLSLLGAGRVRSIIGNVFVPAAIALARQRRDRPREERILEFFAALPREPENKIEKVMLPRIFGEKRPPCIDFRTQQGLLQMYHDWCEPNPSCRNCSVIGYLTAKGPGVDAAPK